MKTAVLKQLIGYGLFVIGFLILYIYFFVVREADKFYALVACLFFMGGVGLLTDKPAKH